MPKSRSRGDFNARSNHPMRPTAGGSAF
jgi:hypothetical protein